MSLNSAYEYLKSVKSDPGLVKKYISKWNKTKKEMVSTDYNFTRDELNVALTRMVRGMKKIRV